MLPRDTNQVSQPELMNFKNLGPWGINFLIVSSMQPYYFVMVLRIAYFHYGKLSTMGNHTGKNIGSVSETFTVKSKMS